MVSKDSLSVKSELHSHLQVQQNDQRTEQPLTGAVKDIRAPQKADQ